jgi:hypothetical protein
MLNLRHNSVVIAAVAEGGWVDLPDGRRISPAVAGWSDGDGYELETMEVVIVPPTIEEQRATAKSTINAAVAQVRQLFITDLPGQQMVYLAKEAEAQAYTALLSPPADLSAFPLLSAEIGITAPTASDLAALWLGMATAWRTIAAQIELLRLTAKAAVEVATTPEQIAAALAALTGGLASMLET